MEKPLISVVMPAYNAEGFLADSVASVQNQSYSNWELLLINDASVDNTRDIIEELTASDRRIKPHHLPTNQGAGFARNVGIKASQGEFICFLDTDDIWTPDKLRCQLTFMKENNLAVSYSSYDLIAEDGHKIGTTVKALEELTFRKLQKANYIGNLTGMYSVRKLGKVYCPLIRKRQDWGLWLLTLQKGGVAKGIEESLAFYRMRRESISRNKIEMLRYNYQVYRDVLHFSTARSTLKMFGFLWEQFMVKERRLVKSN